MKQLFTRIAGAVLFSCGAGLMAGVAYIAVVGGASFLFGPGALLLAFVFPPALLIAAAGFTLGLHGTSVGRPLVPRWVLFLSGTAMLGAMFGVATAGLSDARTGAAAMGLSFMTLLAFSWLREAIAK